MYEVVGVHLSLLLKDGMCKCHQHSLWGCAWKMKMVHNGQKSTEKNYQLQYRGHKILKKIRSNKIKSYRIKKKKKKL